MNFSAQLRELAIAYGLTAVAMLIGLLLMRADRRAYFRWPVYSAMAMALGVVSWNLVRKHLLPGRWAITHAARLYYGALTLYFVIGIGSDSCSDASRAAEPGRMIRQRFCNEPTLNFAPLHLLQRLRVRDEADHVASSIQSIQLEEQSHSFESLLGH